MCPRLPFGLCVFFPPSLQVYQRPWFLDFVSFFLLVYKNLSASLVSGLCVFFPLSLQIYQRPWFLASVSFFLPVYKSISAPGFWPLSLFSSQSTNLSASLVSARLFGSQRCSPGFLSGGGLQRVLVVVLS